MLSTAALEQESILKRRISIVGLSIALAALVLAYIFLPPKIIEITEAQLAQGLEDNLPYQVKDTALVTVRAATAQLSDENKIIVTAQFDAAGFTLEGTGTAKVNSAIRYDKGSFYLSDLRHDDIRFEFSENSNETISDVSSAIEGLLRRETEEAASSNDANRIGKIAATKKYVETQLRTDAVDVLDHTLASFPVYNLNRAEGNLKLAALALDNFEVSAKKILVTLSFQRLIKTLAGIVGTFLLIVVIILGPANTVRILAWLHGIKRVKVRASRW